MRTYGGMNEFLTSALEGGEWSASRPGRFISGERDPAGWAPESAWTRWRNEKVPIPAVDRTRVVEPIA
jgi:hypothetical protein